MLISSLVPLVCGAVLCCLKLKSRKLRSVLVELITVLTSLLVLRLLKNGMTELELHRFSEAFKIAFRVDGAGKVFLALIAVLWPLATLYAFEYMEHEEREDVFFGYYTMTYGVMVLMCCAANLFTLYFCYECLTLVTLPLVWHKKDRDSIHAARSYVCYSIGCAALLFAAMIVIGAYGGGDFSGGAKALAAMPMTVMCLTYIGGFFGFGVKATAFPFSAWLPKACAAPTPVTALLHAVAVVNAGVFSVLRLTYFVFDVSKINGTWAQTVTMIASICTILYGAIFAVRERHVKRKLAYSTISNLGYMLLGVTMMTAAGMRAGMLHMVCHSMMKITLFYCIGAVMCKTGLTQMNEMHGLAKRMPIVFCIFTAGSIALMGIPPFAGFVSKFYLIQEAVAQGTLCSYLGAAALLVSAVLTAVYSLSVLIPAFAMKPEHELPADYRDPGWRMLIPMVILIVLVAVIGIHPQPVVDVLTAVAGM